MFSDAKKKLTNINEWFVTNPAGNYMFKVNNRNTRAMSEICSKLTISFLFFHKPGK